MSSNNDSADLEALFDSIAANYEPAPAAAPAPVAAPDVSASVASIVES